MSSHFGKLKVPLDNDWNGITEDHRVTPSALYIDFMLRIVLVSFTRGSTVGCMVERTIALVNFPPGDDFKSMTSGTEPY